jgi:hypothetical protein
MRILAFMAVLLVLALVIYGVVAVIKATAGDRNRLKKAERQELERSRDLLDNLLEQALDERQLVSDPSPFADIVIDKIRTHNKTTREKK